jgi:hypothetical protein
MDDEKRGSPRRNIKRERLIAPIMDRVLDQKFES